MRFDEALKRQKEQFEKRLEYDDLSRMLDEKPYLMFKAAKIRETYNSELPPFEFFFKNKGRGNAYRLNPSLECVAKTAEGEKELHRSDYMRNSVAMVGEQFSVLYKLGRNEKPIDLVTEMKIEYSDASNHEYIQEYELIVHKSGYADVRSYKEPQLLSS